MNRIKINFCILLILTVIASVVAQNTIDIKVKKSDPVKREFTYLDKPISPLALIALYPIDATGLGKDSVDIRLSPFTKAVEKDTLYGEWEPPYQRDRTYTIDLNYNKQTNRYLPTIRKDEEPGPKIFYTHIGNTSGGKFVVRAMFATEAMVKLLEALISGGVGNFDMSSMIASGGRVFILDLKGTRLIKLADFEQDMDNLDKLVIIQNDTIRNGTIKYPIPLSCR